MVDPDGGVLSPEGGETVWRLENSRSGIVES